jgi:hypothetical protein
MVSSQSVRQWLPRLADAGSRIPDPSKYGRTDVRQNVVSVQGADIDVFDDPRRVGKRFGPEFVLNQAKRVDEVKRRNAETVKTPDGPLKFDPERT